MNTRAYLLLGILVLTFLSGCGQDPCKLIKEFMDKGDSIVKDSSGSDRQRRIQDLFLEYDGKLKNIEPYLARRAKEYVSIKTDLARAIESNSRKNLPTEGMMDVIKSMAEFRTVTLEKCQLNK